MAPELLNKLLVHGDRRGRIVEVEAYAGSEDPGSHAYRGRTRRNATMFGPPGYLYVYFIYGMHWCANVVCEDQGIGSAVLIRALEPISGIEEMRGARPAARRNRDLCSGPAKLCQAFSITGTDDGRDLIAGDGALRLGVDGRPPPVRPDQGPRIGLSAGVKRPWRWYVAGNLNLSRP